MAMVTQVSDAEEREAANGNLHNLPEVDVCLAGGGKDTIAGDW